ncbi:MAG: GDP-mannose 4,6-dehydratase, partial [Fusobacteriaceae bacterium]
MERVSNVSQQLLLKYRIGIDDLNIYIHSGTFKHIARRHPEIQNPKEVITQVLKNPDYIGQHPTEIDSLEFIKRYLVTGGAGFIGANFVKYMLEKYEAIEIVILDKLTYAGNLGTIREELKDSRVTFFKGDICNRELVENIFMTHDIDAVVNFAAESHVDRSIENPGVFLETNILGTQNLMEVAKAFWTIGKDGNGYPIYKEGKKFHHVST